MPTISPARTLMSKPLTASRPSSFSANRPAISRVAPPFRWAADARRRGADDRVADHHRRHLAGRDRADLAAADPRSAPQHGEVVAERLDLAELVADHRDGDLAPVRHVAQEAEDFVGFARRQHRGRLVEDEKALVEIEELEDFELLLLAGRHGGDRLLSGTRNGIVSRNASSALRLLAPVDDGGRVGAADDEVLRRGQRRNQGEVLVDHADAERLSVARVAHRRLPFRRSGAGRGRACRSP